MIRKPVRIPRRLADRAPITLLLFAWVVITSLEAFLPHPALPLGTGFPLCNPAQQGWGCLRCASGHDVMRCDALLSRLLA
jgi:hypothetical protein